MKRKSLGETTKTAGMVTLADGTAERRASQIMLKAKAKEAGGRITVGEDKAYDTADHVAHLRAINVTPHTREVEAGRFDTSIPVTTRDEIGQLSIAFNSMIERLRNNERTRETFGKYIDPRVAKDLLDNPQWWPPRASAG